MLGLNIYSYIEDNDFQFYKTQKALAKKMDVLDWLPGSYEEEIVQGGESPLDRVRRNIADEAVQRPQPVVPEPLVGVHPGNPSRGPHDEEAEDMEEMEEEEEGTRAEGEEEGGVTGFTQQSEAPQRKKAMRAATPQSKLVPDLTVDDARDMFSRDATAAFRERRKLKGKKLYSDYAVEDTIAISSEDEDDMELAKRLRSDPPSPTAFAGMVRVKPEVLTVQEANEKRLREEEQRIRLQKAAAEEPSVRNEVAELRALLLDQERQRAMAQPPSSADLIAQVIQGMWAQGLVVAPSSSFPHLPPGFPAQQIPPPTTHRSGQQQAFSFQHLLRPQHVPYVPVQQMDDPSMWGAAGGPNTAAPPPPQMPTTLSPSHQQDDPSMFRSGDPNPPPPPGSVDKHDAAGQFGSSDPNSSSPQVAQDVHMVDAEGPQGLGDASTPNPVDDPMHDAHAEAGLGQGPDTTPVQEQVVDRGGGGDQDGGQAGETAEASAASRHDQDEVIH